MGMVFENVTDNNGHNHLQEAYERVTPYDKVIDRAMPESLKLDPERDMMNGYSNFKDWIRLADMNC